MRVFGWKSWLGFWGRLSHDEHGEHCHDIHMPWCHGICNYAYCMLIYNKETAARPRCAYWHVHLVYTVCLFCSSQSHYRLIPHCTAFIKMLPRRFDWLWMTWVCWSRHWLFSLALRGILSPKHFHAWWRLLPARLIPPVQPLTIRPGICFPFSI